jgi:hypothetical protein
VQETIIIQPAIITSIFLIKYLLYRFYKFIDR